MPKKFQFPKTIHVTREEPGTENEFLNVTDSSLVNVEDGQEIAVYQLVEAGTVKVTRTFDAKIVPQR